MGNKEIERMMNTFTSKADNTIHSNRLFYKIKESVKDTPLPRLNTIEVEDLKEHLTEFRKINSEELEYKFLSLRNAFMLLKEFEERPEHLEKVKEILRYLKHFEYIFELIAEAKTGKNKGILENAMIILDLEINRFCMKYGQLLTDTDPTNYKNLNQTIETKKIDYEQVKKSGM
jgi:hypothetical protein